MKDYQYVESGDTGRLSKLNSGQLTNFALHDLWVDFFKKFKRGEYKEANAHLDCIWIILGGDEKPDSDKSKRYEELNVDIAKLGYLGRPVKKGFAVLNKEDILQFNLQKQKVLDKALFLRRLQNKQGKGTAYEESIDEYMD